MAVFTEFNRSLSVILLALGCHVLVLVSNPAVAQSRGVDGEIIFSSTQHDFGPIMDTEVFRTSFPFMNAGAGSLVILQVKAGCGCTTPELSKKVFAPGESSEIKVAFRPKGTGVQTKRITVTTNDPGRPIVTLSIKADITPFVSFSPKTVRFADARSGVADHKVVALESVDPDFTIDRISMSGVAAKYFSAKRLPMPKDGDDVERVLIELSPRAPWGSHYANLNVMVEGVSPENGEAISHTAKLSVSAKVSGSLESNATMFQVGIVPPGVEFSKVVTLRNLEGDGFVVLSSSIRGATVDGMQVVAVPSPDSDMTVWMLVLTGTPVRSEQPIRGEVVVTTDVPGEEELTLRIGGVARAGEASGGTGP
tara:strand:+ start:2288 stop:3385 length:1098 start_codon:yes stop_codon:yes gene_type:complete